MVGVLAGRDPPLETSGLGPQPATWVPDPLPVTRAPGRRQETSRPGLLPEPGPRAHNSQAATDRLRVPARSTVVVVPAAHVHPVTGVHRVVVAVDTVVVAGEEEEEGVGEEEGDDESGFNLTPIS